MDVAELKRTLRERTLQLREARAEAQRRGEALRAAERRASQLERELAAETRARTALEERAAATALGPRDLDEGGPDHLFIIGCPRSGTTALATLLNHDERIVVGQERFLHIREKVEPSLFREEVFFVPVSGEMWWPGEGRGERVYPGTFDEYQALRERSRSGTLAYIGDKAPFYHYDLERLATLFPRARFVLAHRELPAVADSFNRRAANPVDWWPARNDYRRAVLEWNNAIASAKEFAEAGNGGRLHVLLYEEFFSGAPAGLEELYAFLELEPSDAVRDAHGDLTSDWESRSQRPLGLDEQMLAYLEEHRRADLEEWLEEWSG